MLRGAVLALCCTFALPAVAAAQRTPADSLLRRIEHLERRVEDLTRRVDSLEALPARVPAPGAPLAGSAKWQDVQNWRQLRRGMKMGEVRTLLGEPDRVEALGGISTVWHWDSVHASVEFDGRSGKVHGWSEPRS